MFVRLVRLMAPQLHPHRFMSLTIPEHARHPIFFPSYKSYGSQSQHLVPAHLGFENFGPAIFLESLLRTQPQHGICPSPITRSMSLRLCTFSIDDTSAWACIYLQVRLTIEFSTSSLIFVLCRVLMCANYLLTFKLDTRCCLIIRGKVDRVGI